MTVDLSRLDAAVKALLADSKAARTTKNAVAEITHVLHAMNPPAPPPAAPPAAGGVGLYQLGGSLRACSHLEDGTYAVVIGDWEDADLLAKVSGDGYAYTATAATAPGWTYTPALEAGNPQPYIDAVITHQRAHHYTGVFLDNCIGSVAGLPQALAQVSQQLRAAGVKLAANVGDFAAGDPGSDDGTRWIAWAQKVAPYLDYAMLENWQQFSGGNLVGQLRGTTNGGNFTGWQRCPGALPGGCGFVGVSYGPPQPGTEAARVYGRAAMLTAPGVKPDAVFAYSTGNGPDPYDAVWTTPSPQQTIDPAALKATL